ncbi:glycosyltransferase 87 family protein [Candidatus Palauibacter sp.]|uniref:glycosyltransferase 87 family protein n=1 Tax=Candidatus Palauibacter sp. TaxID=3101350 RepID=UPI003B01BECE
MTAQRCVWALVAVEAAALWAMAWGAAGTPLPALPLWVAAFTAYLLAARYGRTVLGTPAGRRRIWVGGLALRVGVLPAAPLLSEDIYRFMWDGWVQRHGVNPYVHAPSSPALAELRTEWWPLINHADVPTIYPPGAQLVFALLAWAGPAWLVFKLAWLAADLAVAWLIHRLSRDRGPLPLLLWLWSPLVIVEVAWNGHLDPLGLAPMLGAVALAGGAWPAWRSGALLGMGAAVKFAPLGALPALARLRGRSLPQAGLAVVAALALPLLLYLPYAGAGASLFSGLRTYADVWEFNAGIYRVLERLPGHPDLPKWIGAAVVGGLALRAGFRRWPLERAFFWTIGCALLLSPTLHPWYVLWALPFACLSANRGWLLLSGTVFLSYAGRDAYLSTGAWPEPAWQAWLIHGPPLALLAWDGWRGRHPEAFARRERVPRREQGGKGEHAGGSE